MNGWKKCIYLYCNFGDSCDWTQLQLCLLKNRSFVHAIKSIESIIALLDVLYDFSAICINLTCKSTYRASASDTLSSIFEYCSNG